MARDEINVSDWESFKKSFLSSFGFSFNSLEDVVKAADANDINVSWTSLSNWEQLDDDEILQELVGGHSVAGEVFVVTESS